MHSTFSQPLEFKATPKAYPFLHSYTSFYIKLNSRTRSASRNKCVLL